MPRHIVECGKLYAGHYGAESGIERRDIECAYHGGLRAIAKYSNGNQTTPVRSNQMCRHREQLSFIVIRRLCRGRGAHAPAQTSPAASAPVIDISPARQRAAATLAKARA